MKINKLYVYIALMLIIITISSCSNANNSSVKENGLETPLPTVETPDTNSGEKGDELTSLDGAENESTDKPDQTDKNNTNSDNNTSGGNATPDKSVTSKPDSTSTVTGKSTTKPSINVTDKPKPTEKPATKPNTNIEKPTVIPPTPPVVIVPNGVNLNKSTLTLDIGETFSLLETVIPNNSSNKSVTWNSSKNSVVTVSNGKVTAKGAGTATITVATHNGKTAQCVVTVHAPKPKSAFDRPFDVKAMEKHCRQYGESMGMTWSEPLNPDNCSWDAPGTTHGLSGDGLKNGIEAAIRSIKRSQERNGYQPGEFHFKILFIPLANNEYQIYFLCG